METTVKYDVKDINLAEQGKKKYWMGNERYACFK